MKNFRFLLFFAIVSLFILKSLHSETDDIPEWVRKARIVGGVVSYEMSDSEIRQRIDEYAREKVSALLIWTKSSDDHFFTEEDQRFLTFVSNYIHSKYHQMKVIVYIAPLEEQTYDVDLDQDGKIDPGKKSIYTEHPEWLQVGIDGRPAVFYGNIAFWIEPTSEDVWICPNDPEIRNIWYKKIEKLAKTGIDGLWWDVPFFIYYFGDNWDGNWTCHCDDCQKSFKKFSGESIPNREDWKNPVWRKYIDWRFFKMAEFIKNSLERARKINPSFVIINECWDPSDSFITQTGFSSYYARITSSDDGIAHEFGSLEPEEYHFYSWLLDTVQGIVFRGVDKNRASWILSYSHNKEHSITRCGSVLFSGSNFFETGYPEMAGTIDPEMRRKLFSWIEKNEEYLYSNSLHPYVSTAILYSFPSLKYYGLVSSDNPYEFLGTSMLLLKNHLPFEVLTDDRMNELEKFKTLFLPSVFSISSTEIKEIKDFVYNGGILIVSGVPPSYNEKGEKIKTFPLEEVCGSFPQNSLDVKRKTYGSGICISTSYPYGIDFYQGGAPTNPQDEINFQQLKKAEDFFKNKILPEVNRFSTIEVKDGEGILFNLFKSEDYLVVRVLNLRKLAKGRYSPEPAREVKLKIVLPKGKKPISAFQVELQQEESPLFYTLNKNSLEVNFDLKVYKLLIFKLIKRKGIDPRR